MRVYLSRVGGCRLFHTFPDILQRNLAGCEYHSWTSKIPGWNRVPNSGYMAMWSCVEPVRTDQCVTDSDCIIYQSRVLWLSKLRNYLMALHHLSTSSALPGFCLPNPSTQVISRVWCCIWLSYSLPRAYLGLPRVSTRSRQLLEADSFGGISSSTRSCISQPRSTLQTQAIRIFY
jgi:hypothetical protein